MKKHITTGLLAVAALMLTSAAGQAAFYHVTMNTTPLNSLPASANAPFYLDFQFASGGVANNNTISLSNFTFTGGSATGAASLFNLASGDLTTGVTLHDSFAISELYQGFTAGTTAIGFDVNSTGLVDPGLTPDQFSLAILDSSLGFPAQITTSSPDTLSLVTQDFDGSHGGVGTLNFYNGTGDYAGVTAVPEPATACIGLATGLVGLLSRRVRRASVA